MQQPSSHPIGSVLPAAADRSRPAATAAAQADALLTTLRTLLPRFRSACKQERVYQRMVGLSFATLLNPGRQTVTQKVLSLGQGERDWSAFHRLFSHKRVDEEALALGLLAETRALVSPSALTATAVPYVVGIDGTHIPRSSRKLPLCGWMRAPGTAQFKRGIQPGQRYLHCACLTPLVDGYCRAIPLRMLPAPPKSAFHNKPTYPHSPAPHSPAPPAPAPQSPAPQSQEVSEWQAGLAALQWLRVELDRLDAEALAAEALAAGTGTGIGIGTGTGTGQAKQRRLFGLADGSFDVAALWRQLPSATCMVVRTAKNRKLCELPPPPLPGQCGRRRLYGAVVPHPKVQLQTAHAQQRRPTHVSVRVRGRTIEHKVWVAGPYLREGAPQHPLFLLTVGGTRFWHGKRWPRRKDLKPAYYLVSAVQDPEGDWTLPLPLSELLCWIWQRWELEVAHREFKSGLGVGDIQSYSLNGTLLSVQWAVWFYALLVLAGLLTWGTLAGPPPAGKWRRTGNGRPHRWSLNTLWRSFRLALWRETGVHATGTHATGTHATGTHATGTRQTHFEPVAGRCGPTDPKSDCWTLDLLHALLNNGVT